MEQSVSRRSSELSPDFETATASLDPLCYIIYYCNCGYESSLFVFAIMVLLKETS